MTKPGISIIGAGNVGTQLARAFHRAGFPIVEICSRSAARGLGLAKDIQANYVEEVAKVSNTADVYLFCISEEDLKKLPPLPGLSGKLVCHTSGSTPMEILSSISGRYGVIYPLQTFSLEEHLDFQEIPILLETKVADDLLLLKEIAGCISGNISIVSGPVRSTVHLAAVIACNFSNYLYSCSEALLRDHGLDFKLLHPLILETARKASLMSPEKAQTGPAVRADLEIIRRQEKLLQSRPELLEIYRIITKGILHRYHPGEISRDGDLSSTTTES